MPKYVQAHLTCMLKIFDYEYIYIYIYIWARADTIYVSSAKTRSSNSKSGRNA